MPTYKIAHQLNEPEASATGYVNCPFVGQTHPFPHAGEGVTVPDEGATPSLPTAQSTNEPLSVSDGVSEQPVYLAIPLLQSAKAK